MQLTNDLHKMTEQQLEMRLGMVEELHAKERHRDTLQMLSELYNRIIDELARRDQSAAGKA